MKKKSFLLVIILLSFNLIFAQKIKYNEFLDQLLATATSKQVFANNKVADIRMTARATYSLPTNTLYDTAYYTYLGTNGYKPNTNEYFFAFNKELAAGGIANTYTNYIASGSSLVKTIKYINIYTSGKKTSQLIESWNGTIWEKNTKTDITYTGNKITGYFKWIWNATKSSWDTASKSIISYNGDFINVQEGETYNYNFHRFYYKGKSKYYWNNYFLDSIENSNSSNNSPYSRTSRFEFGNNGYQYTSSGEYEFKNNSYTPAYTYTYGIIGNTLNNIIFNIPSDNLKCRYDFSYNTNNTINNYSITLWDTISNSWEPNPIYLIKLYYENYDNGIGIGIDKNIINDSENLYPNPVNNNFTYRNEKFIFQKSLQAIIYNVLGEIVLTVTQPAQSEITINSENLATGNYILIVYNESNVAIANTKIVKK